MCFPTVCYGWAYRAAVGSFCLGLNTLLFCRNLTFPAGLGSSELAPPPSPLGGASLGLAHPHLQKEKAIKRDVNLCQGHAEVPTGHGSEVEARSRGARLCIFFHCHDGSHV